MKQFTLTPSMGKRLIAKAMVKHPAIQVVLKKGILGIGAGTTNGYIAEEILASLGQGGKFSRLGFRRGIVTAPNFDLASVKAKFEGDVVIVQGKYQKGKEIFDFVDQMDHDDVLVKGANALDVCGRRAAVLVGHPMGGTIGGTIPAVIGRRVRLIVAVGLEKRVPGNLDDLMSRVNAPGAEGPRLMTLPGEVFTELDAIAMLTGASATLLAAGGVYGAEGALWLGIEGSPQQVQSAGELIHSLDNEPPCQA